MTPFRETPSLCLPISHRFQKLFHQRCDSQLTGETADSVLVLAGADSGQDLWESGAIPRHQISQEVTVHSCFHPFAN